MWAPPLAAGTAMLVALTYVYVSLPLPKPPPAKETSFLYDRKGRFLKALHGEVDRIVISLDSMPLTLRQAVIAAEDEDFYSHPGVSMPAIVRAAWANFRGQDIQQGASTITQQYVRNAFPTEFGYLFDPEATEAKGEETDPGGFDRTISRKLKEALLAIKLERDLSKNEILERYLNTIYLGRGSYGVEAAARRYFAKSADELDVLESATLAGLISSPEANNPIRFPDRARVKRNHVLGQMAEMGFLSLSRARQLGAEPVEVAKQKTRRFRNVTRGPAAYFVDYASRHLQREYGDQTFIGGFRVTTTIDMKMQRLAEKAVTNHFNDPEDPDVALVAMDPRTGEVRAMVGGRNFKKAKCNLATADGTGRNCGTGRQTGSAYKMFTVAAAVDKGVSLKSTFTGPGHIVLKEYPECGEWADPSKGVSNYSDSGAGTMDIIGATASSVNTIFAQLIAEVGPARVVKMSHKLGIKSELPAVCSLTLGVAPVSPLEMTTSFATIASGGVRHWPTPVHEIKNSSGEVLHKTTKKGKRVMKTNDAWQVALALRAVVTGGTGTAANLPNVEVIGKTGTSENHANAYFCGSSRIMTACVWVGHKEGNIPMPGMTGGSFPARIWHDFMAPIHEGRKVPGFPEPELTGKTIKGKVAPPAPEKKKKKKVVVPPPSTAPPPPPPPAAQCSDGADNDGDTLIDHPADPECQSPNDDDESG